MKIGLEQHEHSQGTRENLGGREVGVEQEIAAQWQRLDQALLEDLSKRMNVVNSDADSQGSAQWSRADLGMQFAYFWAGVLREVADESRVLIQQHEQFEASFRAALRALLGTDQLVQTAFRGSELAL